MALISIENLSFAYPNQKENVLDDISLSVSEGEFVVICGESGSGKSTLLRQLKREIAPHGEKAGVILYDGAPLERLDERAAACEIGFVMQNPDSQIVTDKVWHELAFGLENLGLPSGAIRRRVAEMASFFGIQQWFDRSVAELSGGQKQMLNLASVMVMQPRVLILDEPTSQLDPIASAEFLETVRRVNRELSLTVILTEHRLEEVFPSADRIVVMEAGRIVCSGEPRAVAREIAGTEPRRPIFEGFPAPVKIYAGLSGSGECPLTVREGRKWLMERCLRRLCGAQTKRGGTEKPKERGVPCAELRNVWFRYEKNTPDILKGVSFKFFGGEVCCILGGNGTGKSTALGVISGLYRACRGKALVQGRPVETYKPRELYRSRLALLPQNPQALFVQDTVRSELRETAGENGGDGRNALLERVIGLMGLEPLLERHPYDLSGGEQQKAAFAKLLLLRPEIILLDEPTKGLDAHFKRTFGEILRKLAQSGAGILMATHDVEFAAEYADRCALFFDGSVVSEDVPARFFSGNSFYTTAADRMSRGLLENAVTCEEVIRQCGQN